MPLRTARSKRGRVSLAVLLALGGFAVTAAGVASATTARDVPTCRDNQLRVSLRDGGVGLGHFGYRLEFTRVGQGTCSLSGYLKATFEDTKSGPPTVSAVDTKSGYLGGLPLNGPQSRHLPVVILAARTGRASVLIEGEDVPVGGATSCRVYTTLEIVLTFARGAVSANDNVKYGFAASFDDCSAPQVHPIVGGVTGSEN